MQPEVDRLFFALWPDEPTRAALAGAATHLRNKLHPVGRWIGANRYHLTLHFLGDYPVFPEALVQRAAQAAASVRSPSFALRVEQAGSFRESSIPWWLGPAQVPSELKALWRALRDALQAHAVPYDPRRRLVPHVTVLRDAAQMLASTPVPPVDWAVGAFALIHSTPGAQAEYRVLGSWPLVTDSTPKPGPAQRDLWDT